MYTDLSLITANQEIGREAAEVFAALLKGETVEETNLLLVAPKCLQNKVLDMIDEEIAHAKKGKALTSKGIYVDQNLHDTKLNSQELFYSIAYSNAEKNN